MNRLEIVRIIIENNYHFLKKRIDTKRFNELEVRFSEDFQYFIGDVIYNNNPIVELRSLSRTLVSGRDKDGYFKIFQLKQISRREKEHTIIKLIVLDRFL